MRVWRSAFLAIAFLLCCAPAKAQDLDALRKQVGELLRIGKYAKAIPIAEQYAEGIKKQFGENNPKYATSLNNLAELYRAQGRYAKAEPYYKRSLDIWEKALGKDHPDVATSLNNLALLYRAQGRYAEAERHYKRSLDIFEKALGKDHPNVARSLNNLAELYRAQGRYAEAEPHYKRSLDIWEKALGKDHPNVALGLNNLAWLYRALNRHKEAEAIFKRADAIPNPNTRKLRIYFATNRQLEQRGSIAVFGTKRGKRLETGQANVIVPRKELVSRTSRLYSGAKPASHAQTKLTSSSLLVIRKINHFSQKQAFAEKLRQALAKSRRFKNQAVVFVHGFNVSFNEAVSRTAQLCFELDFDGACLLFTWPSVRKWFGYATDRASAEIAVDYLVEMLERLATDLPDTKIHLMAHSMGNIVTLQALKILALKRGSGPKIKIGEVVLAHPDVDRDRFTQLIKNAKPLGADFTLYTSSDDRALRLRKWFGGVDSAGGAIVLAQGLDTIDISGLGAGFLSFKHTVFAENPIVFGDITKLLQTSQRPPHKRTEFFEAVDSKDGKYWRYKGVSQARASASR